MNNAPPPPLELEEKMERAQMNAHPPVEPRDQYMEELEAGLRIDPLNLPDERAQQPELFYRVVKAQAAATAERDRVKRMLKEVEAQATIQVRENLPPSPKLSVGEIDARVVLDPTVRYYGAMVDSATARLAALSALREAYVDRGFALHSLLEMQTLTRQPIDMATVERMKSEVAEMRRQDRESGSWGTTSAERMGYRPHP